MTKLNSIEDGYDSPHDQFFKESTEEMRKGNYFKPLVDPREDGSYIGMIKFVADQPVAEKYITDENGDRIKFSRQELQDLDKCEDIIRRQDGLMKLMNQDG